MNIDIRIKKSRKVLGINQKLFAMTLEVTQGTLSKIESGKQVPSLDLLGKIFALGISPNWLLTGEGPMFSSPPTIGGRLKAARQNAGLDQEGFAIMLSCSLNDYQGFESDETEPTNDLLRRLEGNFKVSPVWIRTGQGEMLTNTMNRQTYAGVLAEDDGFRQAVPDVFSLYNENQRLKEQIETAGCAVCSIMAVLQRPSRAKVSGYAEALLQIQGQIEEPEDSPPPQEVREMRPSYGRKEDEGTPMPWAGYTAAGPPLDLGSWPDEWRRVPTNPGEGPGTHYLLDVRGTSMVEARIPDGGCILARRAEEAESGEIVVVHLPGEGVTLKRLRRNEAGAAVLEWQDGSGRTTPLVPESLIQGVFVRVV